MSRLKIKPRKFKAKLADIPHLVDAVFEGDHEMPGWDHHGCQQKRLRMCRSSFPASAYRLAQCGAGLSGRLAWLQNKRAGCGLTRRPEQVAEHYRRRKSRRRQTRRACLPSRRWREAPRRMLCALEKWKIGDLHAARGQLSDRSHQTAHNPLTHEIAIETRHH